MTVTNKQDHQEKSLKNRVVSSSMWTLGSYGGRQLIRLGSNVILAKLLFPEAFGLMMLVSVFMQGIGMFSDIGTGTSIIQNKRGGEANFLNTAWSLQVIRGVIIWLIACAAAPFYANIFNEPLLTQLIPVAGFSAVISGFNSTSLVTANRNLQLKKITILDFMTQFVAIFVMIVWVVIEPSVWGLVAGGLASALAKLILSHTWLPGVSNKFFIEADAAKQMFRFGRWIFLNTALTFFVMQIDRLLFGYLMGTAMLGIYTIAAMFTSVSQSIVQTLSTRVLFPSYSDVIRGNDNKRLYRVLKKTRLIMISGAWMVSIGMILMGSILIDYLYDERYADAVWMIQILPLGMLIAVLSLTYQNVILAKGKSGILTFVNVIQLLIQVTAILIGHHLYGVAGIIVGYTLVGWLMYPVNAAIASKNAVWQPEIDFPVIILAIIFVTIYFPYIQFSLP